MCRCQTEEGDLFKLSIVAEKSEVNGLIIKYFDTVPVANALCLLRNGLLFVAAEFGNHHLYQIASVGDNEDEPTYLSVDPPETIHRFAPRDLLNLALLDEHESMHPLLACEFADLHQEEAPQLYALCGRFVALATFLSFFPPFFLSFHLSFFLSLSEQRALTHGLAHMPYVHDLIGLTGVQSPHSV